MLIAILSVALVIVLTLYFRERRECRFWRRACGRLDAAFLQMEHANRLNARRAERLMNVVHRTLNHR